MVRLEPEHVWGRSRLAWGLITRSNGNGWPRQIALTDQRARPHPGRDSTAASSQNDAITSCRADRIGTRSTSSLRPQFTLRPRGQPGGYRLTFRDSETHLACRVTGCSLRRLGRRRRRGRAPRILGLDPDTAEHSGPLSEAAASVREETLASRSPSVVGTAVASRSFCAGDRHLALPRIAGGEGAVRPAQRDVRALPVATKASPRRQQDKPGQVPDDRPLRRLDQADGKKWKDVDRRARAKT